MITIAAVHAENVMQYRELDFQIDRGVWSIAGKNRSGKSSIFEAMYWCLFGKTARGIKNPRLRSSKEELVVRTSGNKDRVPFIIERHVKLGAQKSCLIVNGGKPQDTGNIELNQQIINKFLGIDDRFFLGSVLFGHNSFRFTHARDSDRKSLLEDALNLDRFVQAKKLASGYANSWSDKKHDAESMIDVLNRDIADLNDQMDEEKGQILAELRKRVLEIELRRHDIELMYPQYGSPIVADKLIEEWNKQLERDNEETGRLRVRLDNAIKLATNIKKLTKCPTCLQNIGPKHRSFILSECEDTADLCKRELEELCVKVDKAEYNLKYLDEYASLGTELVEIQTQLKRPEKSDVALKLHEQRGKKIRQLHQYEADLLKARSELEIHSWWETAFGRQGIISLLIDEAVAELNGYILEASVGMTDGMISAQFDSTTALKTRQGVQDKISMECLVEGELSEYGACSNSEQQRIDMMVMFAWQAFIASRTEKINVAFFDEVFEGLDSEAMQMVLAYIMKVRGDQPTYIMSHSPIAQFQPSGIIRVTRDKTGSHLIKESE